MLKNNQKTNQKKQAIMKLKKNFTSVAQSDRLIAAGVPEDSADCHYLMLDKGTEWIGPSVMADGLTITKVRALYARSCEEMENSSANRSLRYPKKYACNRYMPCWSAGRLIEIIMLCGISANHKVRPILDSDLYEIHDTLIEYLVQELEENSEDWYDFSKLED